MSLSLTPVVNFFAAPSPLVVVERDIRAELERNAISIILPVRNPGTAQNATLHIEILNSGDEVVTAASESIRSTMATISLPFA